MSKAEIGAGDLAITLGEHEVVLKPTLKAAMSLSRSPGGLTKMAARCLDLEFEAIQSVIVAGMDGKFSRDLAELIYQAGVINLSAACITFINIVANGGQPLGDDEPDDETAESEVVDRPLE